MKPNPLQRETFVLVAFFACCGCESRHRPIRSHPNAVPTTVHVILGPGESLGDRDNAGCRLSIPEIEDHLRQLQGYATIFGPNVVLQQPAPVASCIDAGLFPGFPRTRTDEQFHTFVVAAGCFVADTVNIYFAGNVQILDAPSDDSVGLTLDPGAAQSWFPALPWIAINDGGFDAAYGFDPDFEPDEYWRYNVANHEMAHFLARFEDRWFPYYPPEQETRFYDQGEHTYNAFSLLTINPVPPPMPLHIHGWWEEEIGYGTEKREIWIRIRDNDWNNP